MTGIPSHLFNSLREALADCEQFETNRSLRAVFIHEYLKPWQNRLPQADTLTSRVDAVINFLHEKRRRDGSNALVLLLRVLSSQIDVEDERHHQLATLADELESTLGGGTSASSQTQEPDSTSGSTSDKAELETKLQGIESALNELETERDKGMIDIGRYLRLKQEYETRKAKLEQELASLARVQRTPAVTYPERLPPTQRPATITWLHISDLHFHTSQTDDNYDANIVLQALLRDISECIQKDGLVPDFVAVTGDIAFAGQSGEYALARNFFEDLMKIVGLSKDRLFIVPGNHDVDRKLVTNGAKAIGAALTDRDKANKLLTTPGDRRLIMERFKGYADFVNKYFANHLQFDDKQYFYVSTLDIERYQITLLGLNSAWLCVSDEDKANGLLIGERQVRTALKQAKKADLKIALLHHPFDWLREFDQNNSAAVLVDNCDFILHGHLHRTAATQLVSPDSSAMILAGGACYETRDFPNMYNWVRLDLAARTGVVHLRHYSDARGGFWAKDVLSYKNVPDGMYTFDLPSRPKIRPHDKIDSTFVNEQPEYQSNDISSEEPSASNVLENPGIPAWVDQIPEPFIKELEEKLRMNKAYWPESNFQAPMWNNSFAAGYFSQQANRLLEIRDIINELRADLPSTNLGSSQFRKHAHTVLDQVLDQSDQIARLVGTVPQHPLGITTEKAASRVAEKAQSAKHVLRQIALEAIGGPNIHPQLPNELTMLLSTLSISLDDLQKYLQEIGHEAQTIFLSLN